MDEVAELTGLRVLHVVGASAYGGGSKVVLDLVEGALASGATVDVLTTDAQMTREVVSIGAGVVDSVVIERSIRPLRDLAGLIRLVLLLRGTRYDVVQTHTSKAGVVGRFAAALARVPAIVHTVHGFAFHEHSPRWQRTAVISAERAAGLISDRVVTVSLHHAEVARRHRVVAESKLRAIPNGIKRATDVDPKLVAQARAGLLREGKVLILVCGRLAPQKGMTFLLQALELLRDEGFSIDELRVCIAGDGPLSCALKEETRARSLDGIVRFLGFRTDVDVLVDAADYVVLPSLWEGLSIALMEAMSRGAVVATSDIPSNLELVSDGDNAIVFPAGDAAGLADALRSLLWGETDVTGMGKRARESLQASHSLVKMQTEYCRLYEEVLAGKGRL